MSFEPGSGASVPVIVWPIHADATANVTLTNQAVAEQFLGNSNRNIFRLDLTGYSQVNLTARVITGSASANSPRVMLEYLTTFSTTVANFLTLGTAEVQVSLATAGVISSGWIDLVAGAQGDVFLAAIQVGGDAAADPALGPVVAQFR